MVPEIPENTLLEQSTAGVPGLQVDSAINQASTVHVQALWSISVILIVICLTVRFFRWIGELMCKTHDEVLDEYFADLETENHYKPISLQ